MQLPISDNDRKDLAAVASGRASTHDFNEAVARVLLAFIDLAEKEYEPEIAPDTNPEPAPLDPPKEG